GSLGFVDFCEREGLDESVEREATIAPHLDELRNDHVRVSAALEDAGDTFADEREGVENEITGLHADEAAVAADAGGGECCLHDRGDARGVEGVVGATGQELAEANRKFWIGAVEDVRGAEVAGEREALLMEIHGDDRRG